MTNLEVLSAELRKAAKTTEEIDLERAKLHLHNLDRIEKGQITRAQDRDEMEAFRKIAWLPAGLAAQEMVGIIVALKAIKNNDKTTAYTYSSGSKNREGKAPKRGQRWATPYEIAQEELQRLEKVEEAFG